MSAFLPPNSPFPLLFPRLQFITPQSILRYLSVCFLHPFLSLHYLAVHVPFNSPSTSPTSWHEFFSNSYCIFLLFVSSYLLLFIFRPSVHFLHSFSTNHPPPPLCQASAPSLLFLHLAVELLHSCWQCCLRELSAQLHSPTPCIAPHPPTTSLPHPPPPSILTSCFPPTQHPTPLLPSGRGINLPALGCWALMTVCGASFNHTTQILTSWPHTPSLTAYIKQRPFYSPLHRHQ